MDSGRFESVLKPYAFHQVMRSLFVPLRLATDARDLAFEHELDCRVDRVARYVLLEAQGMTPDEATRSLAEKPEEDGYVVGDETRLRQIITNLARYVCSGYIWTWMGELNADCSNACKFTLSGGKLHISTRLVMPHLPSKRSKRLDGDDDIDEEDDLASPTDELGRMSFGLDSAYTTSPSFYTGRLGD